MKLFSDRKWKLGSAGAYKKAITKLLLLLREAQRDGELPSLFMRFLSAFAQMPALALGARWREPLGPALEGWDQGPRRYFLVLIGLRLSRCLEINQTNLLLLCGGTHRKRRVPLLFLFEHRGLSALQSW